MSEDLFSVKGKTVLITGGGRGIGKTMTVSLLRRGARVIAVGRNEDTLKRVIASNLSNNGESKWDFIPIKCDISNEEDRINLKIELKKKNIDSLDVLINNAGIQKETNPSNSSTSNAPSSLSEFKTIMETNLFSLYAMTMELLPLLKHGKGNEGKPSRIINIGSILGLVPPSLPARAAYGVSKAGVHFLTKILVSNNALNDPKRNDRKVLINAVAPGLFPSDMTSAVIDAVGASKLASGIPIKRLGKESDIEGMVVFLCSEASSYIHGAIIPVDGGVVAKSHY